MNSATEIDAPTQKNDSKSNLVLKEKRACKKLGQRKEKVFSKNNGLIFSLELIFHHCVYSFEIKISPPLFLTLLL